MTIHRDGLVGHGEGVAGIGLGLGTYEPMSTLATPVPATLTPWPIVIVPWCAPAGFPSPAQEFIEKALDLGDYVAPNRTATYFVRAVGDSLIGIGIQPQDLLVVDRSVRPVDGSVVIAAVDGELCCKILRLNDSRASLCSANPRYANIELGEFTELSIWGVVTFTVHALGLRGAGRH